MLGGSLVHSLRYLWMFLTKGHRLGSDFLSVSNRRFCNGPDKVIGWWRGYPSYYLLVPPLFSKPAMNSLVTRMMSIYQWRKLPDLVGIGVCDDCNLSCEFCSARSMRQDSARPLTLAELKSVIAEAQALGVSTVNLVGGEPLLRNDLEELVASVDPDRSQVILFTNGTGLASRARSLRKAGLVSVIVAVDAADPTEHDRRKGEAGAFAKAVEGIAAARKEKLLVGLSTVARPGDLENGDLVRVFELGKKLGVNQILVFDAVAGEGQSARAFSPVELRALVDLCAVYHRKKDYPGIHAYAYSKSPEGLGCGGGVSHFYVSPRGRVCPCDFDPDGVGNVREASLFELWDRFNAKGITCSSLRGCRRQTTTIEGPLVPGEKGLRP